MDSNYHGAVGTVITAIMWVFWGIVDWLSKNQSEISIWLPVVVSCLAGTFWVIAISEKVLKLIRSRRKSKVG